MLSQPLQPNGFTFPCLLNRITNSGDAEFGQMVHAHVVKFGFWGDGYVMNGLVHMYLSFGEVGDALRVFDGMGERSVVSWTTVISGLARLGLVGEARQVFDRMGDRCSVSWNAMIAAYVKAERYKDAFDLFDQMREEGIKIDKFVAASMLSACTGLGAHDQGQWIHKHIEKYRIEVDPKLATTIIDMYCKCGCLEKAQNVFKSLQNKGLSSWNCMIGGLAIHGRGEEAIELFKEMERSMVPPDDITLLNVLTACAHSGLVDEGQYYFDYIVRTYNIAPKMEHFGCLVDILGRAGLFEEAKKVLNKMPMDPDARVLGALFGACKIHGIIDLGEQIGNRVIELDSTNSGRYILLANLYASVGRWDDVAKIRVLMNELGVKKEPGWSVIEFDGAINEFIAGGMSHPEAKEIYAKVDEMLDAIRLEGYVPDIGGVLHDIKEEEKENPLHYHSEKLAIGFGLLKTKPGETIRISKNLRVCKDCHYASKIISRAYDREIVVRDRNRFHHFRGGVCSCKDYW
ncbi:pentatricopeptide repeat-containing protein At5g06540-like [Asparagus officinalis]|uniref:pentatricopeptide repeat-containing protein At5g06540-like n=1 Tax=Asparagus officinalis TaxID=4686 RepID=UPI00098DED30|nr:pentatricopeptide repeat-containing protein At5g06540-like [Asparagus officinalis]